MIQQDKRYHTQLDRNLYTLLNVQHNSHLPLMVSGYCIVFVVSIEEYHNHKQTIVTIQSILRQQDRLDICDSLFLLQAKALHFSFDYSLHSQDLFLQLAADMNMF